MEIFDALQVVWDSFRVEGLAHDEKAFLRIVDTGRCYVEANPGHLVRVAYRDRFWYINPQIGPFGPLAIDAQLVRHLYGLQVSEDNIEPITFLLKNLSGNPIPEPQLNGFSRK